MAVQAAPTRLVGIVEVAHAFDSADPRLHVGRVGVFAGIGGDEFLAIGKCNDTASADTVKQKIESSLEEMAVHMSLPYPLTVSIGYQLTEPDSGRELIDYINTADEEMYLCKQEMHRLEDKC